MPKIKTTFAKIAYEAGVKQVVDISSSGVSAAWRKNIIAAAHYYSERVVLDLISTNDVAHLAANIMIEPVEKHVDMVYDMASVRASGNDRAATISRVLARDIKYVQIAFGEAYKNFMEHAHMLYTMGYGVLESYNGFYARQSRLVYRFTSGTRDFGAMV